MRTSVFSLCFFHWTGVIPSLNSRISVMDATINHLEKEKEKLQSRVDEMSDDLNRLDELKSMLDEARSDNERLQK